jgi:hypothetical protein
MITANILRKEIVKVWNIGFWTQLSLAIEKKPEKTVYTVKAPNLDRQNQELMSDFTKYL